MMTSQQRAASLVIPRVDANEWSDEAYREEIFALIDKGVGGIGVFKGTLEDTAQMIADLQARAGGRLLVGADHEFGLPQRITEGGIAFPRAMALGKTLPGITSHVARCIAEEERALGVHWNWAPVADVNTDPNNPVINTRAFGETAEVVSEHSVAFVTGLQSNKIMACAKHAPGHGATSVDSHVSLPTIDVDAETASKREFAPFKACIEAGVGSIMVGHLLVPFVDPDLPASLSRPVVEGLIRDKWGFNGLITTDALDMGAITTKWSSSEAAVSSILAGCDVVLMPEDPMEAIDAIAEAIDGGEISESRLSESEGRWDAARRTYVIPKDENPVDQNAHALIALKAADAALTITGEEALLPLSQWKHIAAFAVIEEDQTEAATTWFHYLAQATELNVDFGYINGEIEERDLQGLIEGVTGADVVIFAFFGRALSAPSQVTGLENLPAVMDRLTGAGKRILAVCGSPYLSQIVPSDMCIQAYSETTPSLAASVLRLIGRSPGT